MSPHGDAIREVVQKLNNLHPTAEFSYGYIGNCGPGFDDRMHLIMTQVPVKGQMYQEVPRRLRFYLEGHSAEGHLAQIRGAAFEKWVAAVRGEMGSEEHQWWHRHIHRNDCPECGSRRWNTVSRANGRYTRWGDKEYDSFCKCMDCDHEYPKS